jgi:hypothetical protein
MNWKNITIKWPDLDGIAGPVQMHCSDSTSLLLLRAANDLVKEELEILWFDIWRNTMT